MLVILSGESEKKFWKADFELESLRARIYIEKFTTCEFLNWIFSNMLDFWMKSLQCVRLILKKNDGSDFNWKVSQRIRILKWKFFDMSDF